jgi:hypothetical protein
MMMLNMLLAIALAANSHPSVPSHAPRTCATPTQTGTFRITALPADSSDSRLGIIVFESIDGCLEATILTEDAGPAAIDHLVVSGDDITGALRIPTGTAKVTLHVTGKEISGSIVEGKHAWRLSGRRTSGGEVRVADSEKP